MRKFIIRMPKRYFLTIKTIELLCEILIRNNDKKENQKIVEMQSDSLSKDITPPKNRISQNQTSQRFNNH